MGENIRAIHKGMPSKKRIIEYWEKNYKLLGETKKGEWGIEEFECFACGDCYHSLDRCHIVPLVYGGSNDLSNLHILCGKCHIESEGLKIYWDWFHYKRKNEWDYGMNHILKRLTSYGINLEQEANRYSENYDINNESLPLIYEELWNRIHYTVSQKPIIMKTLKDFQKKKSNE